MTKAVDVFAGPGGWSEAARVLGLAEVGIERDPSACATRAAAGHVTIRADAATYPAARFKGRAAGVILSPPCPTFSTAGSGEGVAELDHLYAFVHRYAARGWSDPWKAHRWSDPRTPLVLEPLRWAEAIDPEWIALEQVPPLLDLWNQYAVVWRQRGYSVWTGILNAADYGVPQTRRRAFLLASRTRPALPPPPTHSRAGASTLFAELKPWMSMAEALGWGMTERPYPVIGFARRDDLGTSPDGYRERDRRTADQPAQPVTGKARSWMVNTGRRWHPGGSRADAQTVPCNEPAPTVTGKGRCHLVPGNGDHRRPYDPDEPAPVVAFGHDAAAWYWDRPATTIAGDPRCFAPGGHIAHDGRDNSRMKGRSEDAIRLGLAEALILQSFRPDYPLQGSRTKQFKQIGNAVPPALAAAVLAMVAP